MSISVYVLTYCNLAKIQFGKVEVSPGCPISQFPSSLSRYGNPISMNRKREEQSDGIVVRQVLVVVEDVYVQESKVK